jgi:hypothetical protein
MSPRRRRLIQNSSFATRLQECVRNVFFLGHGWGHLFDETSHFGGEVGTSLGLKDVDRRPPIALDCSLRIPAKLTGCSA